MDSNLDQLISKTLDQKMTTQEWVTDTIRMGILNNYFKDGESIPTAGLAEKLGVSRMPIRIALLQLESEGLVSLKPHKPAVAVTLSPEEVLQIYDMRFELEGLSVQLATKEATEKEMKELYAIVIEMEKTTDSKVFMKLNNNFHNMINELSNNEILINLITQLRNKVLKYVKLYLSEDMNLKKANKYHKQIINAMIDRDPNKAQQAVHEHLANTCTTVAENLRNSANDKVNI